MERSALARHRKRRLLDATQHVSTHAELESVIALAGVTDAAHAHVSLPDAVNDAIHVLRNVKNSVYHRALAARALGLLVLHDRELSSRLCMESEELVDALLQIVSYCRHSRVQNADTRRIHVNCCLAISLVMQAPHKSAQLLVSLDSELLVMQDAPSERESAFLFLTVSRRPESGASPVTLDASLTRTAKNARALPDRALGAVRARKRAKAPRHHHAASPRLNNQESPDKSGHRIAWAEPSELAVASGAASHPAAAGAAMALPHQPPGPPSKSTGATATGVSSTPAAPAPADRATMASRVASRQTPSRVFKMERFRVITPAFVHASAASDARATPLPVIRPTSELLQRSDTQAPGDLAQAADSDVRVETSSASSAAQPLAPVGAAATTASTTTLLPPKLMLEVFRSKQMPLASPALFSRHLRNGDSTVNSPAATAQQRPPPSRLQVLEWSEWKQQGLTEETAAAAYERMDTAAAAAAMRPASPAHGRPRTPHATETARPRALAKRSPATAAATKQSAKPAPAAVASPTTASELLDSGEHVGALNTPEYKQKRLRAILSSPVEPNEATTAHLRSLASRVNTSFMVSLGAEIDALRREEQHVRSEMHAFIQAERDHLPLKFLFQLPGGAAYCRHRMRRAMALWVLVFEDNQRRMALLQWKAFVEHCRFRDRGKEYQRLAATKRLRVAVDYVLRGFLSQALTKWVETTQMLIWLDRDCAVRTIQRQVRRHAGECRLLALHDAAPVGSRMLRDVYLAPCRDLAFQLPPRIREERRAIWHAAELVQRAYRRRRFRVCLARYRAAAATIQAQHRMRAARARYRVLRRRIVTFQSYVRMLRHRRAFVALRASVVLVQTAFRSVRVRRLRRLILCAQQQQHERVLSSVLLVQRLARGFLGRRRAQTLRRINAEEFNAALVVQRCWYRRNNEWSTFLLLGCLRVKEDEETAFAARVLAYKRNYMAKLIRRAWLAYWRRKRSTAALAIQCAYRRHAAQRSVQHMRDRKMAHRRIKWFFRVRHAARVRMATLLQFSWLRAVPGRLARHLRHRHLVQQQQAARTLYIRTARAAARMQALVRGHNDRVVARRERSARTIQCAIRAFLRWRRIQRELRRIKRQVAEHTATACVATGCSSVFTQRMRVLNGAATQLQRCVRGAQTRARQTRLIVSLELQTRMARRIQHLWHCSTHWRMAKKLLVAQRRALTNPFQALTSLSAVLDEALWTSSVYFDPRDDLNGMALAVWLRRLGLDAKYLDAFQRSRALAPSGADSDALGASASISAGALRALRRLDPDACRQQLEAIGVDDDDDLDRMLTSLFARETVAETQQLRRRVAAAQTQQAALERKRDGAQMQLEKLAASQRDAEAALEDVLHEMQEFRHPPRALRKRHEQRTQALERAVRAVSDAQRTADALAAHATTAHRTFELLQQQLREIHEPREVSALYTQQSLRLVSDRNRIREMYLAHFPGLDARALAFATALEDDIVSTWQLEQFFATHTSVSAVKAHVQDLAYFALETETKKLDHARFVQCADVLQYSVERMCALVLMPIEVVVLAKRDAASSGPWGPIHDALLAALTRSRRATRASERARAWRAGLDTLVQMNRTAQSVQCMWRRRAATKLLAIVRDRRDRERMLAAYVAEARADHVTPVWAAERKREQDELDAWLTEQALARRRDVLSATLRFPYIEAWDDSAQVWYYYDDDASALNGSGRQFALEGKPVYTIDEEDAAIVIQAAVRAFLVRLECLAREREQRRRERRARLEAEWLRTQRERSQTVTLHICVRVEPNSSLASWLQRRRKAARARASASRSSTDAAHKAERSSKAPQKALARGRAPRPALERQTSRNDESERAPDAAWSKQIDALVDGPLAAAYHRSVRAEHRKDWMFPAHSRPLNVHAQATIGLLSQYVALTHCMARDATGSVRLRCTKGALRFGWREVRTASGATAQSYYYNRETGETTWDRPAYAFAHEFAATQMQSLARVLVAKNALARRLDAISFVETVQSTVRTARAVGWIGFGLEGMTTAVFLTRFGLGKYAKELAKASIDDVLALPPARTKKLGWTKEEVALLHVMAELRPPQLASHRCRRCKYPLSVSATCELSRAALSANPKHPFAILPSERFVTQLVSQSLANQQGRVLALVKAIRASSTPIAFRQLEMHLRKFAGRPDDALSSMGEIASLDAATREPQEQAIATLYLRCIERCVVFAANLALRTLQLQLSAVLCAAIELVPREHASAFAVARTTPLAPDALVCNATRPQDAAGPSDRGAPRPPIVERYVRAALARYPAKIVKGLWEQDPSKHETTGARAQFSLAQLALYLREQGLERVLVWVRSALLCQATFRMHVVRQWYVATQAFRARSATAIQCAWRVRCARDAKALLESQQQSDYEQCFDKRTKSFYFVYTPTQEKLLDEPRDESGAVMPFRPMVQDRVTKRWVRAWPHFDKALRSKRPREADADASAGPPCSICNAARAARRCNECYSRAGDYVDYCLVCFYERHAADNTETSWHSYTALHRMQTPHFRCVECRRFSTLRCLQCDENYCERCFQRLHGKGHTRTAHRCELYDAMAQVCVECEVRVAFQHCLVCLDALCEDCMARTHSRGARAAHGVKLIKQRLGDNQVYCEQCHARCGDARCEYCSRALCALCLSDKHALLCPETELKQKRHALLGDKVCVECGKAADRVCETCGDRYCSVRWMGNPGCFERFHAKGKRADHVFAACEAPAMTPEILELEERVKRKRKQDAEDAEAEAKKLAAAMLALAADAQRTTSRRPSRGKKAAKTRKRQSIQSSGSKRRGMADVRDGTRRCSVETCAALALGDGIAFCAKHFTLQHALEVTQGNPLDAAKLLAQIERAGGRLVPSAQTFLGSTLLGSLLRRANGSDARGRANVPSPSATRSGDRKAAKKAKPQRKTATAAKDAAASTPLDNDNSASAQAGAGTSSQRVEA